MAIIVGGGGQSLQHNKVRGEGQVFKNCCCFKLSKTLKEVANDTLLVSFPQCHVNKRIVAAFTQKTAANEWKESKYHFVNTKLLQGLRTEKELLQSYIRVTAPAETGVHTAGINLKSRCLVAVRPSLFFKALSSLFAALTSPSWFCSFKFFLKSLRSSSNLTIHLRTQTKDLFNNLKK